MKTIYTTNGVEPMRLIWGCACGKANTSIVTRDTGPLTCALCGRLSTVEYQLKHARKDVPPVSLHPSLRPSEDDETDGLSAVAGAAIGSLLESAASAGAEVLSGDTSYTDTSSDTSSWDGGGGDFSGGGSSGDF